MKACPREIGDGNPVEMKVGGFPIPDISGGMTHECYFAELIMNYNLKEKS